MDIRQTYLILTDKLNKLSTNFNQNLPYHTAVRVLNEAQFYWLDERLKKEEQDETIQRELQILLKKQPYLAPLASTTLYNEYPLPTDYYHPSMIEGTAYIDQCLVNLHVQIRENSNIPSLLNDDANRPDYEWEQTIATIRQGFLAVYKDQTPLTILQSVTLHYYRKPILVDLASGYKDPITNLFPVNIDFEWPESSVYEIIDIAVKIIAGNINDQGRVQFNHQLTQEYK